MRNILITGGCGFIGGHLIEELLQDADNFITVIDDFSTAPFSRGAFEASVIGSTDRVKIYPCRIDQILFEPFGQWDEIYHLASVVGPAAVIGKRGTIAQSIISDSTSVALQAKCSKAVLVDVSTSEIYGGGQNGLCAEYMNRIISPKTSARLEYSIGKLAAETALLNTPDIDVRIIRPFNVTGPRQSGKGGFVLPRFIGQAMAGEPITVFGDGQQIRAFTHVKDIVDGIIRAARYGTAGSVYNIGNPENKYTVLSLAQEVRRITQSLSPIVFVDPRSIYGPLYEDANDKYPDATKAMGELQWRPTRGVAQIVADTFEYMKALPAHLLAEMRG